MPSQNRLLVTSALGAANTANALRPVRGSGRCRCPPSRSVCRASELPFQAAVSQVITAAITGRRGGSRGWRGRLGLALTAASCAGAVQLHRRAVQSEGVLEQALVDELGSDYRRRITDGFAPPPDVALTRRRILMPDLTTRRRYRAERNLPYGELGRPQQPRRLAPRRPPARRAGTGAVPGARGRLGHRQQGGPGGAADGPSRRAGLGLRGSELPAQPAVHLARPHRRREAGPRLDQGEHRRPRRRSGLRGGHRRLGRRTPLVARRAHARTSPSGSPGSRTRTRASSPPCRSTASTTSPTATAPVETT